MRTLAGTTSSGVAAAVTLPGYFIEVGFASTQRWSTRGTLTWNSQTWTATDVEVQGLGWDQQSVALTGTLVVGNTDLAIGTTVLADGVADRTCKIWAYYGDTAPGTSDPVQVFDGVMDGAEIGDGPVRISLRQAGGRTAYCPRTYMTPDAGFNFLPTPNRLVHWNGETVRLTPEGF